MSRVEAHRKNIYRPAYYIHKWWARRTGSVFRGILLDLLLADDQDAMDAYYRSHDFSDLVVLDPFMGGGTTVGEALRLGCKVVGCDINPVAWYLVSQSMREVDGTRLEEAFSTVERMAGPTIREMYRTSCDSCGSDADIQYVSWVKQVPCKSCGRSTDINLTQVVMADMATKGAGLVACPDCDHVWWTQDVHSEVDCAACSASFVPSSRRCRNAEYVCRSCGHTDLILNSVTDHPPSHRMRSLTVWCGMCGKRHRRPTKADVERYAAIEADVAGRLERMAIPQGEIPPGYNTNQMRRYGYRRWREMFNARQLAGMESLFAAIGEVSDGPSRELLTLLASASLEFNSMFCGAKGLGTGAIRHVFAHHAFIPPKEPLEANLWGVHRSSGGFSTLFRERLSRARSWANQPVERRFVGKKAEKVPIPGERLAGRPANDFEELANGDATMLLLNQSSEHLPQVPDGSVDLVVTDPPYGDNVMYSELSDYFYVWLKEALTRDYPNFTAPLVEDSREAVHNPGRGRDGDFYAEVLGNVFAEAQRKLKPRGRMAFTFHYGGDGAWESLEHALVNAGFVVERWWPVFAEMASGVPIQGKKNGGNLDIVFVCSRAGESRIEAEAPIAEMRDRLSDVAPLGPADERAMLQAEVVKRHTLERAATPVVA